MSPDETTPRRPGRWPSFRRLLWRRLTSALAFAVMLAAPHLRAAAWALTGATGAHDPTIIKEGSTWWCLTTGTGLPVKYSSDGLNWQQGVQIFASELPWWRTYASQMAHLDVWAPDIHFYAGRYWCYYCVSEFGTNNSAIGLTSCSSIALGDWRDDGVVLSSKSGQQAYNALDPDLCFDAAGSPWLVFGSYFDGIHVVSLDPATMKPTGSPVSIAVRANGIEGSNIVRYRGYFYLFVSIDRCCQGVNSTYKIAYGRSTSITGPYVDQSGTAMTDGGSTVLDAGDSRWKGPGGQSVYQNGVNWLMVYHAYDANNNGAPILQINDLYWDNASWPTFAGPVLPSFSQQPASQTVTAGAPVTFSATAIGSPDPTFQWFKDGNAIAGANSATYSIPSTTLSDNGSYLVTATNAAGSATSATASLTVNPATTLPAFTILPASQTVGVNRSATFTAAASGNPAPSFQWQRLPAGGGTWTNLVDGGAYAGTTTPQITVVGVTMAQSGDQLRSVATNSAGSVSSAAATLTVRVVPADFNGDVSPDLIWQNSASGQRLFWFMNGPAYQSDANLATIPVAWRIVATADFNGDGQNDLVWQNQQTGECVVWFMNGAAYVSSASLGAAPVEWTVAGVADFNTDGHPDLVWQNSSTGERMVWLLNEVTFLSTQSLGVVPTNWWISGVGDFDQDGHADLLWTNTTTGERSIWLMNGTTQTGGATLGIVPEQLEIASVADYDGDGWPDLAFTNVATGERLIWLMQGATQVGTVSLGTITPDWILGTTPAKAIQLARLDFNGDGQSDLLWENTATGEHYLWLMHGTELASSVALGATVTDWHLAATADFNGDGQPDLVWENISTGERIVWLMNGSAYAGSVSLGIIDADWHIADAADFNGDGRPDLVWENTATGKRYLWLMNGTAFGSAVSLGNIPTAWHVAAAADFNADGQPDLVWENSATGEHSIWLMHGSSFASSVTLATMPTEWRVATSADFNGDGQPDLVWENTSTGERYVWLMNGTSFASAVDLGTIPTDWKIRN